MKDEQLELSEWDMPAEEISTAEIDKAVVTMIDLDAVRDEKKKIYQDADAAYEKQRAHVLDLLTRTGKTKYFVEGVGTVSKAVKYSVSMPKDPDEKVKVLNYFKSLGDDVYNNIVNIYYQSLNAYYNQMREQDPSFSIEGVGEPQRNEELRFRKA